MDYPRNPSAPKQVLVENRPNPQNVYTPGFTIEGGKSGLTRSEYQEAIRNHSPLASRCLNKVRWHLLSLVAVSGIGGRFYAKHHGWRLPATIFCSAGAMLFTTIVGANVLPALRCQPEELTAVHQAMDLSMYGPWKRDSGEEQLFRPKEMEMDDVKWIKKGYEPPSSRPL